MKAEYLAASDQRDNPFGVGFGDKRNSQSKYTTLSP